LQLPDFKSYAVSVTHPGTELRESTRQLGEMLRDIYRANPNNFRLFCPDETNSNRLGAVFEVEKRCLIARTIPNDDHVSPEGRVMEVLSEHNCEGWLEGYLLTGRHGLFATYEAFALIVASMTTQHAKWLDACEKLPWRAPIPSLNILLTSTCWRNDHNGFSHQGPGFMDTILSKKGTVARVYLPPDANCLLSVADHCLRSQNYVNLVIIDKRRGPRRRRSTWSFSTKRAGSTSAWMLSVDHADRFATAANARRTACGCSRSTGRTWPSTSKTCPRFGIGPGRARDEPRRRRSDDRARRQQRLVVAEVCALLGSTTGLNVALPKVLSRALVKCP
jgi:phosphoketolase